MEVESNDACTLITKELSDSGSETHEVETNDACTFITEELSDSGTETPAVESLTSNDVANSPMPVPENIRLQIIKQGSEKCQYKEGPFLTVERPGENIKGIHRSLTESWFYTTLPNGTKFLRKWMVYSPAQNKVFCFCCRVFASAADKNKAFVKGFNEWWKLNPKISEHEGSYNHINKLEQWKTLAVHLKYNKTIDSENQRLINIEAKKWRNILTRILDITLFLAQQNLAFRGHREDLASEQRGNFLEMVKLMSKYDPVLKEHYLKIKEAAGASERITTYLSKDIQNEFIFLLGNHVKHKLVEDIKKAKYYGIMFDSTPDQSKIDQMSQVIRYVHIEGDVVEVRESFLGFFPLTGKTADAMSKNILQKLSEDGLDIDFCRAQGYDNAASMAGIHGGVQRKIRDVNSKAIFTPCANHSLNLCGVHSFSTVPSSVTCFGTLEKLYAFFSVSTHRWEMLMKKVNKSLKRLSETRWSAHHESVQVVAENIETIAELMEEMCDPEKENLDTRSAASLIIPAICDYSFLCFLKFWSIVLKEVNLVQNYLQKPGISIDESLVKMKSLQIFLNEERGNSIDTAIEYGTNKCESMGIDIQRRGRRKMKKTLPDELSKDAGLTIEEELRRSMFECVDRFIQELSSRLSAYEQISETFKITRAELLMEAADDELEVAVENLNKTYNEFNKDKIIEEVKRLRRHIAATQTALIKSLTWTAKEYLTFIIKWDFSESLPNITLILQYFLTICVSVASCERSFSKLKLIKNYLRSTMSQERLTNLAMLSIEREMSKTLDFDEIINSFSEKKARKIKL